jgi:Acetyltransferase (GNAT) domain
VGLKFQGKGYGALMNKMIIKFSLMNRIDYIYCHARDTAREFYLKSGYEIKDDSFDELGMTHWYMYKNVDARNYIYFKFVDTSSILYQKQRELRINVLLKQLSESDRENNLQDNLVNPDLKHIVGLLNISPEDIDDENEHKAEIIACCCVY